MKILFLSSVLPHPQVVSGFIVVYQRMKLLAERGHEVSLASFVRAGNEKHRQEIEPMLFEMELLPIPRKSFFQRLQDHLSPVPLAFHYLKSKDMGELVGRMVERSHYDVVVAEFSPMGQYMYRNPCLPAVRRIISCHTCYTIAAVNELRLTEDTPHVLRTLVALRGLQKYEFSMYLNADHVVTLTPEEKTGLLHYEPDLHVSVSPYGVDTGHFKPPESVRREEAIVYTGYYHHLLNQDAVMWFVRKVWPQLKARFPNLVFYLVGRAPTREIEELGRKDANIVVTGQVADIMEYLNKARVFVCPIRMGRGLRGKVLQAMAAGVPVVSTSIGAEGIAAQSGHNMMLADTAGTLLRNISLLLEDEPLRNSIAQHARELVVARYSWPRCVDMLEEVLYKVVD